MTDSQKPYLSIVIPVYRAESCLEALYYALTVTLSTLPYEYEIVLVDDRSPDNSWQGLVKLAKEDSHVRAYRLSRNYGQHPAITAGLAQCRGEYAVVMDCDLQDPPAVIPQLIDKAKEGFDVVLARRKQKQHSPFRKTMAKLYFSLLNKVTGATINSEYGSFSLISRKVIDAYLSVGDKNRHYLFILYWLGFNSTDICYDHGERYSGTSSYSLKALIEHALNGLFFQSSKLLKWIVYFGFACSLGGVAFAAYLIYQYIVDTPLPGWTSLAVLLLLIGGMILCCIGMVGLYVSQIFEQVKNRPLYVIDQHYERHS